MSEKKVCIVNFLDHGEDAVREELQRLDSGDLDEIHFTNDQVDSGLIYRLVTFCGVKVQISLHNCGKGKWNFLHVVSL